jgi:hypothetical protein
MKKILLFLIVACLSTSMYSQAELKVFQDWMTTAGTQNFFYKNVTKTDGSGNVYVAGATMNGAGNYDILLAKFNSSGVQQWIQQVNGTANSQDFATALQVDGSGNVYITGCITNDTSTMMGDLFIKKYNSSGTIQWTNTYDGFSLYDCGTDIYVAAGGSLAVVGSSYNASVNLDFVTILYNSSGVQQWATRYAHASGGNDVPVQIAKKGAGMVVSGAVQTGVGTYSWAAISYSNTGVFQSSTISAGGATGIEEVRAMVTDANGYIYLAGFTPTVSDGYDYDVIKLDSNLVIQWERTYDANGMNDKATAIQVNSTGDVYVTGYSHDTIEQNNYLTLKYNSSGTLLWTRTFNDSLNGNDEAYAMAIDNSGKIYVTGNALTSLSQMDYHTIKYDTAGTVIWSIDFDGAKHLDDRATNIAIDTVGAVIVTGASETAAGVYEYATVRYIEKNIINPTDFSGEKIAESSLYYENKGQLIATDSSAIPSIRYYTNNTNPHCYFKENSLCMVFSHVDDSVATNDTLHRIDLTFTNSNQNTKIYPLDEVNSYLNYFLAQCPDGITKVHGNEKLVMPNLYNNIDLVYASNNRGFKYYFVVKPGGNPDNIRLQFTGASSTSLSSHILTINSSIGSIAFTRPFMYQIDNNNDTVSGSGVLADWHSNGSNNYDIPTTAYDSTKAMIIIIEEGSFADPLHINNPEWYMYLGGSGYDEGTSVTNDTDGNSYFVGYTSSDENSFPISTGIDPTFNGVFDAYIAKFGTANGTSSGVVPHADEMQWSTYFGGSDNDRATSVSTNGNGTTGYVYIAGYTESTNMSVIHGIYNQAVNAGGTDAFILKLDNLTGGASGSSTKFSSYFGGASNDYGYAIKNDALGNFYLAGSTSSTTYTTDVCAVPSDNNFPKCNTESTFNNGGSYGGGTSDGFISKFTNSGTLKWSSFYGGDDEDAILALTIDDINTIYFAGKTSSSSGFPLFTSSGTDPYNQGIYGGGASDAFVGKFNSSGTQEWCSYFGGSGIDEGKSITVGSDSDVYIGGLTSSSTPADPADVSTGDVPTTGKFPLKSGGYMQLTSSTPAYGGGASDGFFAYFDNTNSFQWGTYYGGNNDDEILGLAIYIDDLYFVGKTSSTSPTANMVENLSLIQPWYLHQGALAGSGTTDGFIGNFSSSHYRVWGSYIGANGNDVHASISVWGNPSYERFWYTTGKTTSTNIQTMAFSSPGYCCPDAFSQSSNEGGTDALLTRFSVSGMFMVDVEEVANSGSLDALVYPNPTNYNITLKVTLENSEDLILSIYDITGKLVSNINEGKQRGEFVKELDFANFNNGIYILTISTGTKMISKKIIKHE